MGFFVNTESTGVFLSGFSPGDGTALNAQLAAYLRQAILSGAFDGGERLPSLREIARACNVNYFSVQLATEELMREGLLYKVQGKGMFVRDFEPRGGMVLVLVIEETRHRGASLFVHAMVNFLCRALAERGLEALVYHDNRAPKDRGTTPDYLLALLKANRLAAVAAMSVPRESQDWFDRLPLPHLSINMIMPEDNALIWKGLHDLMDGGRFRHPLVVYPQDANPLRPESPILAGMRRGGIDCDAFELCPLDAHTGPAGFAKQAFEMLPAFFARNEKPDLLLVYPDVVLPGVIPVLLNAKIRIPEELTVVCHRNVELPIFCPFPVQHVDVSIETFAERYVDAIWQSTHTP